MISNAHQLSLVSEEDYFDHEVSRIRLLHYSLGKSDKAFPIIIRLNQSEALKKYPSILKRFNSLVGSVLSDLNRFDESLLHYKKCLKLSVEQDDSVNIKGGLINIGIVYELIGDHDSAIYYYSQAKELEEMGIMKFENNLANNLAQVYCNTMQFEKAIDICKNLVEKQEYDAGYNFNLGAMYYYTGLFNESIPLLDIADSLALSEGDIPLLADIYATKRMVYESIENFELAFKFEIMKDSITQALNIDLSNRKFDKLLSQQDNELNILKLKNKEVEIGHQKTRNNLLILLAVVLALLVIGYIIFAYRQAAKNRILVKANLDLAKEQKSKQENQPSKKRDSSIVSSDLLQKIKQLLIEEEWYKKADLTLATLAKKVGSNTTVVSNLINDYFKMPFRDFINQLRIEEARKIFSDKNYDHYSIEGVSQIVGYRSISSFNVNFKKITGITPSYYRNKIEHLR